MKAKEFERRFDTGEDVSAWLDSARARRPGEEQRRVNVDFPAWMVAELDLYTEATGLTVELTRSRALLGTKTCRTPALRSPVRYDGEDNGGMNTIWSNVLRGCAYGDAWGHTNEFRSYATLTARNPKGPGLPEQLIVTDDTQMTLSLARALDGAATKSDDQLRQAVVDEFVEWLDDPDNNRAPDSTCLAATRHLARGLPWTEATVTGSDGCGAVMRVSPAAFLRDARSLPVAAWQAAATHGAAAGIVASIVTTAVIRLAADGLVTHGNAITTAVESLERVTTADIAEWLVGHPLAASVQAAQTFLTRGCYAVRACLDKAQAAVNRFRANPWAEDPCAFAGGGWRAQETLAVALLCVDALPGDPVEALRRATVTNGDSDSIAAVAGAILGAAHRDPWPAEWDDRLEPRYRTWIAEAEHYDFGGPS